MDTSADDASNRTVSVKFFTKILDTSLQVPATTSALPASTSRKGLSAVINHFLSIDDQPRIWDFMVKGELLRSSLDQYLEKHGLSGEAVLEIEYFEAVKKPESDESLPHPDCMSKFFM